MHVVLFPYFPALHGRHTADPGGVLRFAHCRGGVNPPSMHSWPTGHCSQMDVSTMEFHLPGAQYKHMEMFALFIEILVAPYAESHKSQRLLV